MSRTVKVRVAVAVDETGAWHAAGWSEGPDDDVEGIVGDGLEGDTLARYWIEAEVRVPETAAITGRVTSSESESREAE